MVFPVSVSKPFSSPEQETKRNQTNTIDVHTLTCFVDNRPHLPILVDVEDVERAMQKAFDVLDDVCFFA